MSAKVRGPAGEGAATTWRVRLALTRAEADAVPLTDAFADAPEPPTLVVDEPDPARPDEWTLDAWFTAPPTVDDLAALHALAPAAAPGRPEAVADRDWVSLSQAGFAPVRAGRFVVHTAMHAAAVRPGDIGVAIEAGLAFGTGQHVTTRGCLDALDAIARRPGRFGGGRFARVADLGTGTGVLAIAAGKRWPRARVVAADIDPIAVAVARGNLRANHVRRGRAAGQVDLVAAAGTHHPRLRGPFDLIVANILAAPLIAMAGDVAAALAPGGTLVLAGLLTGQARAVAAAYVGRGCRLIARCGHGEWPTLVLRRSPSRRHARPAAPVPLPRRAATASPPRANRGATARPPPRASGSGRRRRDEF